METGIGSIKKVLMERDKMSSSEAERLIADAREEFNYLMSTGNTEEAETICEDWFGLEPDYIFDLI